MLQTQHLKNATTIYNERNLKLFYEIGKFFFAYFLIVITINRKTGCLIALDFYFLKANPVLLLISFL